MTAIDSRTADTTAPSIVKALIRRIVVGVAAGQKNHLEVVFSDRTSHETTRLGDPDVTINFRHRRAERRMALGGMFEFLESYFEGDVDIVGEQEALARTQPEQQGLRAGQSLARHRTSPRPRPDRTARSCGTINCYHVTFVKGHFAGAAP